MERALVVVEPTAESKALTRKAGTFAECTDATIVLIHATTDEEYAARKQAMTSMAGSEDAYTTDDAREGAERFARDVAAAVLSEFDVEYETAGYVGDNGGVILDAAAEYDCDHVFLSGRKRSPAGKALFGDATQKVLLEYDGPITVVTN